MKKLLDDIKSARWAIILIIAYFALFRRIIYTICPVVLLTGYPCPGCGLTRATIKLLKFDFYGAWQMHPFIYVIVILAMFFCINRYFLDNKYLKILKTGVIIASVAMIAFYIWRMMTMFPEVAPMTYYYNNCLKKILYYLINLRIA